jgi:hypothetical protein
MPTIVLGGLAASCMVWFGTGLQGRCGTDKWRLQVVSAAVYTHQCAPPPVHTHNIYICHPYITAPMSHVCSFLILAIDIISILVLALGAFSCSLARAFVVFPSRESSKD